MGGSVQFRWWLCKSSKTSFYSSWPWVEVKTRGGVPEGNVSKFFRCVWKEQRQIFMLCTYILLKVVKQLMDNLKQDCLDWFLFHFDNLLDWISWKPQQCSYGFGCWIPAESASLGLCMSCGSGEFLKRLPWWVYQAPEGSGIHGVWAGCPGPVYDVGMMLKICDI